MLMPARSFTASTDYRYGFNGKEKDKNISSLTTYDYGFRIYSPAIGKFLSVDPLFKNYPWNSTYAFAENDVVRSIDLDGKEKLSYLDQYQYNGSWGWFDWLKAVPNAAGRVYNGAIAGTWNSGVDFFTSASRGTLGKDLKAETKQIGNNIKNQFVAAYNYHSTKPIGQQFRDFGNYLIQPQRLEDILVTGASLYAGNELSLGKGNLIQPEARTAQNIVAKGISGKSFTEGEISSILKSSSDDLMTLYRATSGTEKSSGALFVTTDAEYAASYGTNVESYQVSRSGFNRLQNENLIEPLHGVNSNPLPKTKSIGPEFKIPNQVVKETILKSKK